MRESSSFLKDKTQRLYWPSKRRGDMDELRLGKRHRRAGGERPVGNERLPKTQNAAAMRLRQAVRSAWLTADQSRWRVAV